jgi:hypothetical protein
VKLLKMCVTELRTRFIVSTRYLAKVVDADGVRLVAVDEESTAA